jgi:mono/diheme cytochrome c family protein
VKNLSRAFALTSLVYFGVLAISPVKEYLSEWRGQQQEYNRYIAQQPRRMKPVPIGIKQTWVPQFGRVDRCPSCHVGLEETALTSAPHPFRTHPKMAHDLQAFGCTVCHEGQGPATTAKEAHGVSKFWERPMLPARYVESSCGKCHQRDEVEDAPSLTAGRRLLKEAHCAGCHKIGGIPREFVPALNGVGSKVNRAWLARWLHAPKSYWERTRMPDFLLSGEEAGVLADYLMTFTDKGKIGPLPEDLRTISPQRRERLYDLGQTRLGEARCISCHAFNGKGGTAAPDLGRIGGKVSPEWLYSFLRDPRRFQPEVEMPRYGFSDEERLAVVVYMMAEFTDPAVAEALAIPLDPGFHEKGKRLFRTYNCAGCHELEGSRPGEEMGPELSTIGSKRLYEIEFGRAQIPKTLPDYLYAKLARPRVFADGLRMPDYGFSEEEAVALTNALLSLTAEKVPEAYRVPQPLVSSYAPQGEVGRLLRDYACFGCHQIHGRGSRLAHDLTREGSQAQSEWIRGYFTVPYSLRPILRERMPNLFMKPAEVEATTRYLSMVLLDDSLEVDIPTGDGLLAEKGKRFYEDYGCPACHQLGTQGGYVGPPLTDVGSRLTPGWIYRWLENPQRYDPDTVEPNHGLNASERRALTAYLASLKGEGKK